MIKKLFKTTLWVILLFVSMWTSLYVIETCSHPFATREQNITRVNIALIQQYEKRKENFSTLFARYKGHKQNDTISRLPIRTFYTGSQ